MSNSIFGSPSRLLTQFIPGSTPTTSGNGVGTPTPVYQQPPTFADVRFNTIGKPPDLLSRISAHDSTKVISRSPSPATSPPLPISTHERVPNSRTLGERIQMDSPHHSSSVRPSNVVYEPVSKKPRIDRSRYPRVNPTNMSNNLMSPIVFPTASESSMPSSSMYPHFQALAARLHFPNEVREAFTPELVYPATTPITEQSNMDSSSLHNPSESSQPNSPVASPPQPIQNPVSLMQVATPPSLPSAAVLSSSETPEAATAEAPQQQVTQDTLSAMHERLRANPPSTLHPRSLSPLTVPSSISELAAGIRNEMDTEEDSTVVLRYPYAQSSSTSTGNVYRESLSNGSNALTLTNSKTPSLSASRNTHLSSLVEAMKKLQTAAGTAVQIQLDADQAFESERMEFDEQRKMFEERMLAREAEYQAHMQAVQKQLEELRAREQRLVALEEESRLREESRRARDNQQRLEDESRRKAIQDEIAVALQLLEEAKAEKSRWQEEKERAERDKALVQNNAPPLHFSVDIEPRVEQEDGMTEEEMKMVNQYNSHWVHLNTKVPRIIDRTRQLFDTLQRMKETRLQAAEAERRRIADEEERMAQAERQRIQAEESARAEAEREKVQIEAERQRVQAEWAAKRDEEKRRSQDQVLNKQQPVSIGGEHLSQAVHAQPQAHPELHKTHSLVDTQAEYARLRAQVLANKQQITSENASRIRARRAGLAAPLATQGDGSGDTIMDMDGLESSPVRHTTLPAAQNDALSMKLPSNKTTSNSQGASCNVMPGTPSTTSQPPDAHTPSTPTSGTLSYASASYKTPSFVSASTEVGRQVITDAPLYPTEFASELNRSPPPNVPTSKNIPFSTTPKKRTILQVASQINECTVGPPPPASQDANLRHIKNRYRLQNNSGDRHVKQPDSDDGPPIKTIKTEEMMDMPHDPEPRNAAQEGVATRPTDAVQHYDLPHAHVISNPSDSQQNNVPQTPTEPIIPVVSSCTNPSVGSVGDASRPTLRLSTTPISPDPLDMDASVHRGWNAKPVSPRSEPSEPAYHRAPEEGSRQHSQTSARAPSPESATRSQHTYGGRHYADHHSPHHVSPTSSRPRLEQDTPGASRPPALPPRPHSMVTNDRKRPAESDNEDDSRHRRRRGDFYRPEQDRHSQNVPGLPRHHSPAPTAERRMGRSISPNDNPYFYRPSSPESRVRYSPINDRPRVRNEGTYRPDYTNIADYTQHPTDAGYRKKGIPLLGRISSVPTQAGRGNPARGRGRGRGDSGSGRGGRGRAQPPPQSRSLEERLSS